MQNLLKSRKILIIFFFFFITSFTLGFHNATLFNPSHGFDGIDHLNYIKYLNKYWQLPPINLLKEYHQSPLYYSLGAVLIMATGNWKAVQYINIYILWIIIGLVGLGLWKVFKKIDQILIGMLSLAALPMLNIFPAMITNELLNTLWIVSGCIACLFFITSKKIKETIIFLLWFTISFIIGYWTKVSIILIIPAFIYSYIYLYIKQVKLRITLLISVFVIFVVITFSVFPLVTRARKQYSASDITLVLKQKPTIRKDYSFFYRLDWIPNIDMYNTQYYSLFGGAWNSFWTDGHNAITPFVKFHKKSFVLWSLGFILLPICFFGLKKLSSLYKKESILINIIGITMLVTFVYANLNNHYSAARLTYEMGIVIPYAFGIAGASQNKKLKWVIVLLLSIQFIIMVSFFWILPWWHVTK